MKKSLSELEELEYLDKLTVINEVKDKPEIGQNKIKGLSKLK